MKTSEPRRAGSVERFSNPEIQHRGRRNERGATGVATTGRREEGTTEAESAHAFMRLYVAHWSYSLAHVHHPTADLSGYWVLSKTENFDECLKALGAPWIVRKAATKFCHENMEIVRHVGHTIHITTLNPKGSWYRVYDTSKVVTGEDVAGNRCEVKSGWDGTVLCATMESPRFGKCETWRFVRGSTMVVKTMFSPKPEGSREAQEKGSPDGPNGSGSGSGKKHTCYWIYERMEVLEQHLGHNNRKLLKKHLADDQKRVLQSTEKDTSYMRSILLDWQRWESPADEFIIPGGRTLRTHRRYKGKVDVSRGLSPARTSQTGTPVSLSASASANQLSKMGQSVAVSESQPTISVSSVGTADGSVSKEIQNIMSSPQRHHLPTHPKRVPSPGMMDANHPTNTHHPGMTRRFGSTDNLSERDYTLKHPHYRSASGDSLSSMQGSIKRQPLRPHSPPSAAETNMSLKLHEFVETYGITSVIPVRNPHDTSEPELLGMSPEQAEETTAKLRELETDMLLRRQEDNGSVSCCGLVISLKKDSIPEHLRVWEMTLYVPDQSTGFFAAALTCVLSHLQVLA